MKLSHFDVKDAPIGDLKAMISMCEQELKTRENARRDELIKTICDSMNQLHKEYPLVRLTAYYRCSECETDDDMDIIDYFCNGKQMSIKDFCLD